jgi:GR25 family glycosyltransferase involved in LPS biosynthesis
MRVIGISIPEHAKRLTEAKAHCAERRVPVEWIQGINSEACGLVHTHPYPNDGNPNYLMPQRQVGCMLSHYMVWTALQVSGDACALVIEDDAHFPDDWYSRTMRAILETPPDADMLLIGSSNCDDKPKEQIGENVWEVKWPFATHAYVLWQKAIPVLLATQRDVWAPVDLSLYFRTYPKLRVFTVLPRIVDQRGTPLSP